MFHAISDFLETTFGIPGEISGMVIGFVALVFLVYYYLIKKK
tara:strand:+ start:61 stop:186 length:126 start_codon:yes stop_codon:yes gene_type:complete